ncbi:MAG: hypothetical protein ABW189_03770 [Rickettsiales bacterium]
MVSSIIDCAGVGYVEFGILTGVLADADAAFAVLVEDGNVANLSDATAVDDKYLEGTEAQAGFTFADDGEVRRIGYRPNKRYVRLTITPSGNSGSAPLAAFALLSGLQYGVPTQPDS